jgi:hypothetical protein
MDTASDNRATDPRKSPAETNGKRAPAHDDPKALQDRPVTEATPDEGNGVVARNAGEISSVCPENTPVKPPINSRNK